MDDTGRIQSVFERLKEVFPVICHHMAYVSADVTQDGRGFTDCVAGTYHMSHQIDRLLRLPEFPDLLLFWIGHNNLDWAAGVGTEAAKKLSSLPTMADAVVKIYRRQLGRVIERAAQQKHRIVLMIFALVSFEAFFKARQETEEIKTRQPERYPFLEPCYRYFVSMRPEYRAGMVELANAINLRLNAMTMDIRPTLPANVKIVFSNGLHDAPIGEAKMLSHVDAWHPSALGHQAMAASVYPVIHEQASNLRDSWQTTVS